MDKYGLSENKSLKATSPAKKDRKNNLKAATECRNTEIYRICTSKTVASLEPNYAGFYRFGLVEEPGAALWKMRCCSAGGERERRTRDRGGQICNMMQCDAI